MIGKRAVHFLLLPELAYSPPNKALVTILLELGYQVDLFAPGAEIDTRAYGPSVRACTVSYGYQWLLKNLPSTRWLRYDLFSGTTEDPMAVAGNLARLYRRNCITMADEIKNGSFSGNRSRRWKSLCRRGMRASSLTVVNEAERVAIQRDYAGLAENDAVVVYPGCFHEPPAPTDSRKVREARGIPIDALLVCYSGVLNEMNGGLWLARALSEVPDNVWFWGQFVGKDPLVRKLFWFVRGSERLVLEPERLPWMDAWASMGAVDIGIVVYLQDAPQFRHMGTASNRLCMFLAMGVPVVASRQPSFEFIEQYDCGVLVDDEVEFAAAINHIAGRLDMMKNNALRCAREYIDAPGRYRGLKQRIAAL